MMLDAATLFAALVLVSGLLSALLFLSWLQNRAVTALAWWALAYALATVAIALLGARGRIPNFLSIDVANAIALIGFGVLWRGMRVFDRARGHWWIVVLGALLWLAACRAPGFYEAHATRMSVVTLMIAIYAFATAAELWFGGGRLPTRRVTALFLVAHGLFLIFVRIPYVILALDEPRPIGMPFEEPFYAFLIFESLVFTISGAFLLLSTAKEQLEMEHRRASLVDPLTGIANRRGFFAEAERALARAARDRRPTALLVFDLDHFKSVNDTFGHQTGDRLLQGFAAMLAAELRPGDRVGRIGGEEFAALLAETEFRDAEAVAERLRAAAARIRIPVAGKTLTLTTSIGLATASEVDDVAVLLAAADAALYRAKANGRDRVESAALPRGPQAEREGGRSLSAVA